MAISTPNDYEAKFTEPPEQASGYTKIICTHAYHGMVVFYVSADAWGDNIRTLLAPYWINGYVILMQPMEY